MEPPRRRCCCRLPRFVLIGLLLAWLVWVITGVCRICRLHLRDKECRRTNVPPWAVRKADPLIYSQPFLQAKGLAVTWDNPDIHVELAANPGVAVDSHSLTPATPYVVVARIWNGSTDAPAVELPVTLSYLEFGVSTVRHEVATVTVDLAVKGAPGCPAFARIPWTTPPTPGHYCLQVELIWADDLEPGNNLGQHNTDVKPLNSPHAAFTFPVRNDQDRARHLRFALDAYAIPPLEPCNDERGQADDGRRLRRHDPRAWPIPEGWRVLVDPESVDLVGQGSVDVTVDVTAPDGFRGRQAINVSAFEDSLLVGGVTLYVEGEG